MFSTQAKLLLALTSLLWLPLLMAAGQPEFSNANANIATAAGAVEALPATSNVMHQLAKRMDLEVCIGRFDVHKNTIIRTGESQAIGGKYLQGLELDTIEECERLCCETDACDVYIFERKAGGYCYLFECGPPENFHCKFTRHANYTSAVLTPHHASEALSTPRPMLPHIPSNNISQQEWELSNLKLKPEVRDKSAAVGSASAAATALNAGVAPGSAGHSASSTSHCGRFQFSCHSGECIAVYNACDGIPQCEDGSDEGPECNAVSSSATKPSSTNNNNNNLDTPKPIVSHYNPTNLQQQQLQAVQPQTQSMQQQQHVEHSISLGPPPPPPPPPPMVNNREDAAAWANRKIIANAQSQPQNQGEILNQDGQLNSHSIFNHKGGLQFQVTNVAQGQGQSQLTAYNNNDNNNNNNVQLGGNSLYGMSLPRSGIYMPPALQQQQQPQQPQNLAWPQAAAPAAQQQQQQQPLLVQQQQQPAAQSPAYTVVNDGNAQQMPVKPIMPHVVATPQQQQQQQVLLPVLNAAPSHGKVDEEEYEDYEEEKSTEAPKKKQRKHKKTKSKTNNPSSKDPIELALEQTKQMPPAVPASPVHEQYKMIHDNLELEFRDHDGHSERPGGAVLSLTMGLLVTAALAILIGCRMRTVGRRARRLGGKTPYSQEADFLVNGMYL